MTTQISDRVEVRFNGAYVAQVPENSLDSWLGYVHKMSRSEAERQGMTLHPVYERYVVFVEEYPHKDSEALNGIKLDECRTLPNGNVLKQVVKDTKLAAVRLYKKIERSGAFKETGWSLQHSMGEGWINN